MKTFFIDLLRTGRFTFNNKHILCVISFARIDHRLVLGLVGLVGRMLLDEKLLLVTVEQLFILAVDQLQNPIHHSLWSNRDRVVMRSLVVVEEIRMIFHTKLFQSSISQLLEYNKLKVFLEG